MQKKLIALAIAGMVAAPAFAADNVTVYGVAGVYLQNQRVDTTTAGVNVNTSANQVRTDGQSGSRLGFKGSEDLGGGLKANFVMETSVVMDAPAATLLGNRQAYAGLSGNWGALTLGHQYGASFWFGAVHADIGGYADWDAYLATGTAANTRISNSIQYASPNFSGFSARITHGLSEGTVTPKNAGMSTGVNLDYANGPLWVGYYHQGVNVDTAVATGTSNWDALGASYDFGMAKVVGSYQWEKVGITNNKFNAWQLGADIKAGANGSVIVQFANRNDKATVDTDRKAWTLYYSHMMSKRTNLVVGYGASDQSGATGVAGALVDTKNFFGGMRHTF